MQRLEGEPKASRIGEESELFMKEDAFSSSSEHLVSIADDK